MTDLAQIPVVAGGTTYQITGSNLSAYFNSGSITEISNGTTEINIGVPAGNANISVAGTSNVAVFTTTGLSVSGTVTSGNITAGNLDATNLVVNSISSDDSSFVNIEDGMNVNGTISATGNISTDTNVVVTPAVGTLVLGNATATNSPGLSSTTSLTLTANRAGTAKSMELGNDGNLSVPGAVYTTANITGGNISTAGYIGANTIGVSYSVAARTVVTDPVSFGDLTAAFGARAFINDGNLVAVGNFGAQVSGGGGNSVPIWSDGANWYIG